nr:acyltransferase family protein [Arthrobacter sp. zg-Y769]
MPSNGSPRNVAPKSFRPDIQGLRAIAVLAVVADHLLGYPAGGFVGVDIFLVVSGFLITGLLLREQEKKGRISFGDFYRRRVKRIVPVAVVVLAVTVAASWAIFSAARAKSITWDAFFALIFGANWQQAAVGTDYMQAEGPVSPLQHFWSLAVEEQFYVVWPWLVVLVFGVTAPRLSKQSMPRRVLAAVLVLVIVATFAYAVWESSARPTVAYFSTVSRTWELAVGALLAVVAGSFSRLSLIVRTVLGYVGLAGIAWSLWFITAEMAFPGPWAVVPVLATALVIAAGTGGEQRYLYPLTNRFSAYIGDVSYSLYLWHFPVIIIMDALIPQEETVAWSVMILGIFALSVASYHFLEDPIRKSSWLERDKRNAQGVKNTLLDHTSPKAAMGVLVLVTALTVTLAITRPAASEEAAPYQPGSASLSGPDVTAPAVPTTPEEVVAAEITSSSVVTSWPELSPPISEVRQVPEWTDDKCLNVSDENLSRCAYGDPAATRTAVVLGDSVAISWMPGLRESLGKQGWKIQLLTKEQCPAIGVPVRQYGDAAGFTEECDAHQRWATEQVVEMNPDMVIVSSALGTRDRMIGASNEVDVLAKWRTATVSKLEEMKESTDGDVVLISVPMRVDNLLKCATRVSKPQDCMIDSGTFYSTVSTEGEAASSVEGVRFISTVPWFCGPNRQCPPFAGSTPIYAGDGGHITPEYSVKLAPVLGQALLGANE